MIENDLSPQQIEGRLKLENKPFVSHETIYKIICENKKNGSDLYKHCCHKLKHRKRQVGSKMPIKNRVSIDERPKIVDEKTRFGDWEIDTIVGENNRGAIYISGTFIRLQTTTELNLQTTKISLNN
jgi:IS30 family transposase